MKNNKKHYNNLIYNDKVLSVDDIVFNKPNIIQNILYKEALNTFVKLFKITNNLSDEQFNDNYIIKEIKNNNYTKPSKILLLYTGPKNQNGDNIKRAQIIDLFQYWPKYEFESKGNTKVYTEPDLKIFDEVVYIDYAKGTAIVKNKLTDKKYTIYIKDIDNKTNISDNIINTNTFTILSKLNK